MYKILSCILIVILLSGCWDAVVIEERGFIVAVAIDLAEESSTKEYRLTITNQFVVPSGMSSTTQGGGAGKAFVNISASGESIYAVARDLSNQTGKIPFFEHMKIIIVSEEVAAIPELFANVMDVFIRNRDTRRGILVVISQGEAKELLNIQPDSEKLPAKYIHKTLEHSLGKTGELKPVRVGDIHENLLEKKSFVLSEISANDKKLLFVGGTIYNGNSKSLNGKLSLEEMLGYQLITGHKVEGPIVVDFEDHLTVFSIRDAKSDIKVNAKSVDNIEISIKIKLEGEIQETFGTVILQDQKEIRALEKTVSDKVKEITQKTLEKTQKELEVDIFGFEGKLKKFHHNIWQNIKKDWDQGEKYFVQSKIKVEVDTEIRSDGVIDISKDKRGE